jgi:hypothetical protein
MTENIAFRSMVKLIHADNFLEPNDAQRAAQVVSGLSFTPKLYGWELENFNMVFSKLEPVMSKVLGERVVIDHKRSGIFRRPLNNVIHFEEFNSLNEWAFVCALEKNTLNLYHHLGPNGKVDAETALQGHEYNYMNLFEWNLHTNILLDPSQGVFFRPWVFHSLDQGLVQYYRLLTDRKFRVLVMGPPGSQRALMARLLSAKIENSSLIKSMDVRIKDKDIDYTSDGRLRQTYRMLTLARGDRSDCVILDHACVLEEQREIINPDILIYMKGKADWQGKEEWEEPKYYDFCFEEAEESAVNLILTKIQTKRVIA